MFCNLASAITYSIYCSATSNATLVAQKGLIFTIYKIFKKNKFKIKNSSSPLFMNSCFQTSSIRYFHSYRTRNLFGSGSHGIGNNIITNQFLNGQSKLPFIRTLATSMNSFTHSTNPYSTNVYIGNAQKALSNLISNSKKSKIDWKNIDGLENMNYKQYSLFLGESIKLINENNKLLYKNWYKAVLSLPSFHVINNIKPSLPPLPSDTAISSSDSLYTSRLLQSLRPLMFEKVIGNEEIEETYFESRDNLLFNRMSQTYSKISYEDALYLSASTLTPEYKVLDINSSKSDFIRVTEDYIIKDVRLVLEQLDHYITSIDSRPAAIIPDLYKKKNWSVDPTVSFVLKHNKEMLLPIIVEPYSIASLNQTNDNSARSQMILRKLFSCCLAYAKDTVILTDGLDVTVYKFNIGDSDSLKTMVFPIGDGRYGEAYCINYQYKTFYQNNSVFTPKSVLASLVYDEYRISLNDRIKSRRKKDIEKLICKITKPDPVMMFDDIKEDKNTKEALIIQQEEISKQWKCVPEKIIHKDVSNIHYEMMQKGIGRLTSTISLPVEEYIDLFDIDTTKVDLTNIKNVIIKLLNFKELGDYYKNTIDPQKCTFDQFYDYSLKCHEYEIKAYRIITEYNKSFDKFSEQQIDTNLPKTGIKRTPMPKCDNETLTSTTDTRTETSPGLDENMLIHSPRYLSHGWCCLNSQDLHIDGYFLAIEKLEFHECKPKTKYEFATGLRDIELMAELGIEHGDLALRNMCYDGSHVYFYDFNRVEMGVLQSERLLEEYKTRFIDSCEMNNEVEEDNVVEVDINGNSEVKFVTGVNQDDPTELGIVNPTDERDCGILK